MDEELIFNFKADISKVSIPKELNNPFGTYTPEIVRIAAAEFQDYISSESQNWEHDFYTQKGKMFGVLVVQKKDGNYAYLGTISGKLQGLIKCDKFVPSILDDSVDHWITEGMTELTEIGRQIEKSNSEIEIEEHINSRRLKSVALQQRLFENYRFLNLLGKDKNVIEIFDMSSQGYPPSAAGECAAPKLLQYALKYGLRPIAMTEFWWGSSPKSKDREHKGFYPACKNRCRPILEYMLNDSELFIKAGKDRKLSKSKEGGS